MGRCTVQCRRQEHCTELCEMRHRLQGPRLQGILCRVA
ncbi:hypothetical protein IEO21_09497 [Rhodonia placenta]|uniref:Uncharacterized protein n=1 Tax=Rhodonia placenta TaxID=104341 RepID=A0A8H7NSX1_9APHY|nr:hypothetical protein IEO21_10192 [Postia placenta]KAF9803981.1 hypothetical protein IEO21_09497 [Postia placenta]